MIIGTNKIEDNARDGAKISNCTVMVSTNKLVHTIADSMLIGLYISICALEEVR